METALNKCESESNIDEENESDEQNDTYDSESGSDILTDDENTDFEFVDSIDLEQNEEKDCGRCSKILTVQNSYKCKICGIASHRTKGCNTCFDHVKKHYFCGGCVYNYKIKQ